MIYQQNRSTNKHQYFLSEINSHYSEQSSHFMQMKPPTNPLPPLAFGGRSAKIDTSADEMRERLIGVVPGFENCISIGDEVGFKHQSSLLDINGLKIAASASTPVGFTVKQTSEITLLIPFAGSGNFKEDGRGLGWQAGINGILLPNCNGQVETSLQSMLIMSINLKKLQSTFCAMLGVNEKSSTLVKIDTPNTINFQVGRLSFETVFRQIANLLDQFALQPELLNLSGIDDYIYRYLAVLLNPSVFLSNTLTSKNQRYTRRLLDRVCEYVRGHLSQPITLSSLERISNMSARNLHYAFLKRYNTTPMKWVRTERLILAHNQLIGATPECSVSSIAHSCGFSKPATFAQYYKDYFGELPSITLARSLAR